MLSPGLFGSAGWKSALWSFEMTPAVRLSNWESLRLHAGRFPGRWALLAPRGNLEAAKLNRSRHVLTPTLHTQKEILKLSDKKFLLLLGIKITNKQKKKPNKTNKMNKTQLNPTKKPQNQNNPNN